MKTVTFSSLFRLTRNQSNFITMKRRILIIATAVFGMALASCTIHIDNDSWGETIKGNGNIVEREFDVTQFDELSCAMSATVNFNVSDNYTCKVRTDENIMDYLDIKVEDEELCLGKRQKSKHITLKATEFVMEVTAPSLENINLAGSGDINILSPMDGKELEVNVAGSGNMVFKEEVNIDQMELNVAGSGDINIEKGSVREMEAVVAGSGKIVLHAEVQEMDASIAGSGDIIANVNGMLEYSIMGSGDIQYYGDAEVKGEKLGSGKVTQIEAPAR